MTHRENLIRAYTFQHPERIPMACGCPPMLCDHYDEREIDALICAHTQLFPGHEKGSFARSRFTHPPHQLKDTPYTDGWGCVWQTNYDGMVGAVIHHPLQDWTSFETFSAPDIDATDGMLPVDWAAMREGALKAREDGHFLGFSLPHGHTFLRVQDLRGYVNLVYDMCTEEPRLDALLQLVEDFNLELIDRYLALNPDMIAVPEDLGMQTTPMLSPEQFRRYIVPSYTKMMQRIRAQGVIAHMHSDGYILDLADDIVACGCSALNLQDLVNGIDNIRDRLKGRVAIDLDVDRQDITVNGSPKDVDDLIREEVEKLGDPSGGLSLVYQPWPPTPIKNIAAVMDAMEKYCTYY